MAISMNTTKMIETVENVINAEARLIINKMVDDMIPKIKKELYEKIVGSSIRVAARISPDNYKPEIHINILGGSDGD